jgi:hypothetical protein
MAGLARDQLQQVAVRLTVPAMERRMLAALGWSRWGLLSDP